MNTLHDKIRAAKIAAAEQAVIDSLPNDLLQQIEESNRKFAAAGGCPGCGSKLIAVHYGNCPELEKDEFI